MKAHGGAGFESGLHGLRGEHEVAVSVHHHVVRKHAPAALAGERSADRRPIPGRAGRNPQHGVPGPAMGRRRVRRDGRERDAIERRRAADHELRRPQRGDVGRRDPIAARRLELEPDETRCGAEEEHVEPDVRLGGRERDAVLAAGRTRYAVRVDDDVGVGDARRGPA